MNDYRKYTLSLLIAETQAAAAECKGQGQGSQILVTDGAPAQDR